MAGERNSRRWKLRRVHILGLLLAGLLGFILYVGGQVTIPIRSRAGAHMRGIRQRIVEYYGRHGKMPADLGFLAELDPPVRGTDPWGSQIIYRRESREKAVLVSLGGDGLAGGTGADADLRLDVCGSPTTCPVGKP